MAGLDEMAIAIATVLQTSTLPEPLPIELRGQTLQNGAYLVRAVVHECAIAGIPLNKVQIDKVCRAVTKPATGAPAVLLSAAE